MENNFILEDNLDSCTKMLIPFTCLPLLTVVNEDIIIIKILLKYNLIKIVDILSDNRINAMITFKGIWFLYKNKP